MPRRHQLRAFSGDEIKKEYLRRERKVQTLTRRRNRLIAHLHVVDQQIRDNGGNPGRLPSGRPRNDTNLIEALQAVLKGKQMKVSDAVIAVQKAGYRSNSPNFRIMVNTALTRKKYFKKVEHGVYTAA